MAGRRFREIEFLSLIPLQGSVLELGQSRLREFVDGGDRYPVPVNAVGQQFHLGIKAALRILSRDLSLMTSRPKKLVLNVERHLNPVPKVLSEIEV